MSPPRRSCYSTAVVAFFDDGRDDVPVEATFQGRFDHLTDNSSSGGGGGGGGCCLCKFCALVNSFVVIVGWLGLRGLVGAVGFFALLKMFGNVSVEVVSSSECMVQ